SADENAQQSRDNLARLEAIARETPLRIVKLPYPRPVMMSGQRLPASYANFYIANGVVLVPTFNDPMDRVALDIMAAEFPDRAFVLAITKRGRAPHRSSSCSMFCRKENSSRGFSRFRSFAQLAREPTGGLRAIDTTSDARIIAR